MQRDQLVQRMPQGSVVKFHVLYEDPWWRDEGLSGMVLAPGEPIGVIFDCTPPAGRPGLISGLFAGPVLGSRPAWISSGSAWRGRPGRPADQRGASSSSCW